MSAQRVPINRLTVLRFVRAVRNFTRSEVGGKAKWLFGGLIALLFGISGLNVVNSYVGRDFMTAIEQRSMAGFTRQAFFYVGVFAFSTLVAVIYRFTEERLALLWREWLTGRLIATYLTHPTYYRLSDQRAADGEIANPDQRIADDVRAFTTTTLSFVLLILNGVLTMLAFSGVLWSVSPLLFVVAVSYAGLGSLLTVAFGRPLVWLNYNQSDQEANLRAALIHVRENAESLMLLRYENHLRARLLRHLDALIANFRRIITINRNVGFFTTGYNYLIQIIPALIVAPLFIRGEAQFGIITQSAIAFSQLLGAFSLVVTQFQSISSFAAVVARLGALAEGIERAQAATSLSMELCVHGARTTECPICFPPTEVRPAVPAIIIREENDRIAYERLTLRLPPDDRIGVRDLTVSIPSGMRTLVLGPDEFAKETLIWATVGVWDRGEGRIVRPACEEIMILPERPYLPSVTLRELLASAGHELPVSDERAAAALHELQLDGIAARAGGLDVEQSWDTMLSLGEQQLVSAARLLLRAPRFALLHRISTTLNADQIDAILRALVQNQVTYVTFEQNAHLRDRHDAVLELAADGGWTFTSR